MARILYHILLWWVAGWTVAHEDIALVQERHPREQGLKPDTQIPALFPTEVQERHPREQGLKQKLFDSSPYRHPLFKSDIHENKD